MRRLLSLVLLAVFILPVILPALALGQDPESKLPACCRRNGKHHCMMSAEEIQKLLNGEQFTTVRSKCPFCPGALISLHQQNLSANTPDAAVFGAIDSIPIKAAQNAAWARAAEAGARHKRGPPAVLPS